MSSMMFELQSCLRLHACLPQSATTQRCKEWIQRLPYLICEGTQLFPLRKAVLSHSRHMSRLLRADAHHLHTPLTAFIMLEGQSLAARHMPSHPILQQKHCTNQTRAANIAPASPQHSLHLNLSVLFDGVHMQASVKVITRSVVHTKNP